MSGTSGRLLALLSLLQARRDWPGQALADRLEVSQRTVRRDVDRLRELGYPIRASKGPDGGYRLDAGADLPPLLFDDDQAVALTVALQMATTSGAAIGEAAMRALATVRQVMPSRLRHRIDAVQVTPLSRASRQAQVELGVLTAVSDAVRSREVLRFDYADAVRRAEPHHVVARGSRWYLLAWDLDRADWRTFRIDRMTPRVPTGPRFAPREVPGGDPATFVSARFKGSAGADVWPCTGEAVLEMAASEVRTYAPDLLVEALGPQRCRVVMGAWSWTGLAASFGRLDAELSSVGPPELKAAFGTLAQRFTAASRSSDPTQRSPTAAD